MALRLGGVLSAESWGLMPCSQGLGDERVDLLRPRGARVGLALLFGRLPCAIPSARQLEWPDRRGGPRRTKHRLLWVRVERREPQAYLVVIDQLLDEACRVGEKQ